jgi:hypothetical protein
MKTALELLVGKVQLNPSVDSASKIWLAVLELPSVHSAACDRTHLLVGQQDLVGHVGITFIFGRNLQCQPVKGVNTREECHWSHAWQRFKRSKGVKLSMAPSIVDFCRKTSSTVHTKAR